MTTELEAWHRRRTRDRAARVVLGFGSGVALTTAWLLLGFLAVLPLFGFAWIVGQIRRREEVLAGAALGVAAALVATAYMNRTGPGYSCHVIQDGIQCDGRFNPMGWLVAGAVFALLAFALAVYGRRARSDRQP
jgi:hypothetical protein